MSRQPLVFVRNNALRQQAERSLPAFVEETQIRSNSRDNKQKLWLCIYLPSLVVDALDRKASQAQAIVVYEESAGRAVIHACNQVAMNRGIHPATTVAAALSLCDTLEAYPRDRMAEQQLLNRLARWASGFSSAVSLYTQNAIMLEIKGSLRLFGGMRQLVERIKTELEKRIASHCLGIAPMPRAAFWLAQSGRKKIILHVDQLAAALRDLPVDLVAAEQKQCLRLERSGIRTLGDIMRLPRDGLARRFGAALLKQLDYALARETEPVTLFQAPEHFSACHAFDAPTCNLALIKPAAVDLLRRLEAFLAKNQAATQQIQCILDHEKQTATVMDVGCRCYTRRAEDFACLLATHLEQLHLSAETVGITIRCKQIDVFFPRQFDLFQTTPASEQSWQQLLAHIEARLGRGVLRHLSAHADYRPEKASGYGLKSDCRQSISCIERPLWLLPKTESLSVFQNKPCWQGPLRLGTSIERIEQGWWDDDDISRDYYIARNKDGSKLWVYRDRRQKRWFMHGLFA